MSAPLGRPLLIVSLGTAILPAVRHTVYDLIVITVSVKCIYADKSTAQLYSVALFRECQIVETVVRSCAVYILDTYMFTLNLPSHVMSERICVRISIFWDFLKEESRRDFECKSENIYFYIEKLYDLFGRGGGVHLCILVLEGLEFYFLYCWTN